MIRHLKLILTVLLLAGSIPRAFALHGLILVTKENQARLGVKFTLSAVRASESAVIVRMEIPREGKLTSLKRVTMDIGVYKPGIGASPMVSADLETTQSKDGSLVVNFQVSPEMADKCSILLGPINPATPMNTAYYSVALKGYITDRK